MANAKYQHDCAKEIIPECRGLKKFAVTGIITLAAGPEVPALAVEAYDALLLRAAQICASNVWCWRIIGLGGASSARQGFSSFRALKRFLGDPGEDMDWHHIVEQIQIEKSGFPVELIQNTENVLPVERVVHYQISGYYASIRPFTDGLRVRDWLAGQSFETQFSFGLQVLRDYGVIP